MAALHHVHANTSSVVQVAQRMFGSVHKDASRFYKSFYSSVVGGITIDRGLMFLPIDDHMVHRGHGVFDTALVVDGNVYQLEQHLTRFLKSAEAARIPAFASKERIKRIILDTAAAARTPNGACNPL